MATLKNMHEVFQVLRTVAIMELGCSSYLQYPDCVNPFKEVVAIKNDNLNPSKLAIIVASDDLGYDEGDTDSIVKMHRLICIPNTLYDIIDMKTMGTESISCWYLVTTDNPEYLCDLIALAHAQSQVDKLTYKFNEKYKLAKKRKFDDIDQ